MNGRKKPYTQIGIRRLKCFRCGNRAECSWQACADDRLHRPLCPECDIALNEMVLKWMGFSDWREKMEKYMAKADHHA